MSENKLHTTSLINCHITSDPIDLAAMHTAVGDPSCGAISSFVGVVRESSMQSDGCVTGMYYEAYVPMAEATLNEIAVEATERFRVEHIAAAHRMGMFDVGDVSVAIVVSSKNRTDAIGACSYIIEELKQRVPIWKKEVFADHAEWVGSRG